MRRGLDKHIRTGHSRRHQERLPKQTNKKQTAPNNESHLNWSPSNEDIREVYKVHYEKFKNTRELFSPGVFNKVAPNIIDLKVNKSLLWVSDNQNLLSGD